MAVAPDLVDVPIHLVGGDDHDGADPGSRGDGVEHVERPVDVRLPRGARVAIGLADERLRSQVQDDVRRDPCQRGGGRAGVADVHPQVVAQHVAEARTGVERVRRGVERQSRDVVPESVEQQRQPRSLEPGVPRDQVVHQNVPSWPVT